MQVNTNVVEKMTTMISEKPVKKRLITIKWKLVKLLSTISRDFHYNFGLNNNSLSLNVIISPDKNIHGEGGTGDTSVEPEKAENSRKRRRARRKLKHASDNSSSGYNSEKNEQQDENELQDDKQKINLSEEKANTDEEQVTSRQHIPVLESKNSLDARLEKEKRKRKSTVISQAKLVSPVVGFLDKNVDCERNVRGQKNIPHIQDSQKNLKLEYNQLKLELKKKETIEEKLITKTKAFLNKNKDLHEKQWFYGMISEQETTDLMAAQAKIGDFIIREDSGGGFVLSVQNKKKDNGLISAKLDDEQSMVEKALKNDLAAAEEKVAHLMSVKSQLESILDQLEGGLDKEKKSRAALEKAKKKAEGDLKMAQDAVTDLERTKREIEGFIAAKKKLEHSLQGQLETHHLKIQTDDGKYLFLGRKFDSLADYVKYLLRIGVIQNPLGHKQKHKKESQQRYRGNNNNNRIYCYFCQQFHGQIHYCNEKQCFMNYDHINMMLLEGPKRESVERLPGYHVDDARMRHYKTKFDMTRGLMDEAESVRGKKEEEKAILGKIKKDYTEMKERMKEEKLKKEREIEKKEEMEKRMNEELSKHCLPFYQKYMKGGVLI